MESRLFLNTELQNLANKFEGITLSSFYDEVYTQHVIIISPKQKYLEESFAEEQIKLELAFIEKFPYESLYFVEEGGVEIPKDVEIFEVAYTQVHFAINKTLIKEFVDLFEIHNIEIETEITAKEFNSEQLLNTDLIGYAKFDSTTLDVGAGEDNSYAMAA